MRKTKLLLFALVLTLGVGMLVGCNKKSNELTEQEITSFAVLTSARLNSQVVGGNYVQDSDMNLIDEKTINDIDKYFAVLEYYLDGGSIAQDTVESDYEDEEGNKPYEHMIEWHVPSKEGHVTYIFHYNETLKEEDIEDDEHEQEFSISGIMVFKDVVMTVHGEKEIEIEEDEYEISYKFYSKIDDNNYVEVKYEKDIEDDEQEEKFFIKSVKDGVTSESKIKLEVEDGKETELKFKSQGVEYELKIKATTKDGFEFVLKFDIDGDDDIEGKVYVKRNENTYTYKVVEDDDNAYEFTIERE